MYVRNHIVQLVDWVIANDSDSGGPAQGGPLCSQYSYSTHVAAVVVEEGSGQWSVASGQYVVVHDTW